MKEVGDQQIAAGDVGAASKQYAELLDYAAKNRITEDPSGTLAEVRRRKAAADAKVAQQAEASRQAEQREVAAQATGQKQREAKANAAAKEEWTENAKKRWADIVDNDPVISFVIEKFPDLESLFKVYPPSTDLLESHLRLAFMSGGISLAEYKHVEKILEEVKEWKP